jgi:inorganic pyrophosphatase
MVRIRMLAVIVLALLVGAASPAPQAQASCPPPHDYILAPGYVVRDYCVVSLRHPHLNFYRDIPTKNAAGLVNAVTEIPAGSNDKFEVGEDTGKMCWEFKNGVPRVIKYLGYPANYGMVPRTLGGDGDSLDVLTLGRFERRGSVLASKVIGVLKLIDGGDIDDKIIAVVPGTDFYPFDNISDLEAAYPGVESIIETWFTSYKGPGEIFSDGFRDAADANAVLDAAMAAYN